MLTQSGALRRPNGLLRTIALAVLFALQGAMTVAPLLEPTEKGRLGAHAEERGAHHKYQHDETTCAVCAVRSLHSSPAQSCVPIECDEHQGVAALQIPVAPHVRTVPTALPRAPPHLS